MLDTAMKENLSQIESHYQYWQFNLKILTDRLAIRAHEMEMKETDNTYPRTLPKLSYQLSMPRKISQIWSESEMHSNTP